MAPAIGIDLGTTYSCVAALYKGNIEIIPNDLNQRRTPSCVWFSDKERLVGDPAKRKAAINPTNTIYDVKRLIGRRFDDPTIQEDIKNWPFDVIDVGGKPMIKTKYLGVDKVFVPEEISAMILTKMKETAEKFLGTEVKDAVITVPAYFNDSQRQATKDAGTIAGLNVLRIINEPTAAALAYGFQKDLKLKRNVLIYDLGGGTFDVTVLTISEGSVFEVKSTSGDTHLGGEDFDRRIVKFLKEKLEQFHYKENIKYDHKARSRLKAAAEVAKHELSSSIVSSIDIESLINLQDFSTEFSRACFNELCMDLFKETLEPVKLALADAKMDKDSIDDIVLVGGSTRIPKVQEIVQEFFSGKKLNLSINPDEAVAYGAAIEAAILSGDPSVLVKDVVLVDVTPLSLGIETKGGLMSRVIERNTQIPFKKTKNFTVGENQTSTSIEVFEGERALTADNNFLGKFVLYGIPPGPHGAAKIEVTFDLDANSILKVSAVETTEGSSKQATIREGKSNLTRAEINRMRCEAECFKAEDEREFARINERNSLDTYIRKARNALSKSDNKRYMVKCTDLCDNTFKWLSANPQATKEAYENQKMLLKFQLEKIISIV